MRLSRRGVRSGDVALKILSVLHHVLLFVHHWNPIESGFKLCVKVSSFFWWSHNPLLITNGVTNCDFLDESRKRARRSSR